MNKATIDAAIQAGIKLADLDRLLICAGLAAVSYDEQRACFDFELHALDDDAAYIKMLWIKASYILNDFSAPHTLKIIDEITEAAKEEAAAADAQADFEYRAMRAAEDHVPFSSL